MPAHPYFPDSPAEKDALGRIDFSNSLARALVAPNAKHGFVVGIEGPWGSGKSSIIEFAKRALTSDEMKSRNPIVVDFNPWMVSNTGALVEAFLVEIASAIKHAADPIANSVDIADKLLGYVGVLRHLKALKFFPMTGWIGNVAQGIGDLADSASGHAAAAGEAIGDMKKILPTLDLAKRKAELKKALADQDRTIVVIIDDLDRLPADEIRTVVQAVKAIADFPRTTYLLAYDRAVVAKALGNGEQAAGDAYLEKIVQIAYPIPPVFESQLREVVSSKIHELLKDLHTPLRWFEQDEFERSLVVVTRLLRHPRDVFRLLNRLVLSLPATYSEVNVLDVIVFEALSQRFPAIRDKIHRHPVDFVGHAFRGDLDDAVLTSNRWKTPSDKKFKHAWEKHLPGNDDERAIVGSACEFLFPVDSAIREKAAEDRLRLADRDRLARFLRKSSLDNIPDASRIHPLLRNPKRLATELRALSDEQLVPQLEWIELYAPSCTDVDTRACIDVLISESHARGATARPFSGVRFEIGQVIERLLRLTGQEQRAEILRHVVENAPLGIAAILVYRAGEDLQCWGNRSERAPGVQERLTGNSDSVTEIKSMWLQRFDDALASDQLGQEPMLHETLDVYGDINDDYTGVYNMISLMTKSEAGLGKYLLGYKHLPDELDESDFPLVDYPEALANRVRASAFASDYVALTSALSRDSIERKILERTQKILENEKKLQEMRDAIERRD